MSVTYTCDRCRKESPDRMAGYKIDDEWRHLCDECGVGYDRLLQSFEETKRKIIETWLKKSPPVEE